MRPLTEGASKNVNPPNPSADRPPAPGGSGGKERMMIPVHVHDSEALLRFAESVNRILDDYADGHVTSVDACDALLALRLRKDPRGRRLVDVVDDLINEEEGNPT